MPKPVRFTHFKGLEGAHFEPAHGTAEENIKYCSKEESRVGGPYIFGKASVGQGNRADIIALRDAIRAGKRADELFGDDRTVVAATKYTRAMDKMVECFGTAVPRDDIVVTFHYGPSGTGKTHCASSPGAYYFDGNNGFWNGYKGETSIILDEFGGHCLTPLMFQRLCDKYPLLLNIKGGSMPCAGRDIHICSNYLPSQWWSEKTRYHQGAVYRRITVVHYHDVYKHFFKFVSDDAGCAMEKLMTHLSKPLVINKLS